MENRQLFGFRITSSSLLVWFRYPKKYRWRVNGVGVPIFLLLSPLPELVHAQKAKSIDSIKFPVRLGIIPEQESMRA